MRSRTRRALSAFAAAAVGLVAVGGAVGLWPVGAPADSELPAAEAAEVVHTAEHPLLQPVLAMVNVVTRDMEGLVARAVPGSDEPKRSARQGSEHAGVVPPHSGTGRRVVFDMSAQRVWLVRENGTALRSYPVSGSKHDNLSPGHYEVYSTSRHATSYTYVETMEYMVRFTRGENAAIGFHDIPVRPDGEPVQTRAQLGEPLSSGCIRQRQRDAKALWDFAPVGTEVVVIA